MNYKETLENRIKELEVKKEELLQKIEEKKNNKVNSTPKYYTKNSDSSIYSNIIISK